MFHQENTLKCNYVLDEANRVELYKESTGITFNHKDGNTYRIVSLNAANNEKLKAMLFEDMWVNAYVESTEATELRCRLSYGTQTDVRDTDVACLVDVFLTPEQIRTEVLAYLKKARGYAYASGETPYDKYSTTMLSVANYAYEIHVDRVNFFYHFADKSVDIEITDDDKLNIKHKDKLLSVLLITTCDSVSPQDCQLTDAQADRIFKVLAATTPLL